MHNPQPRVERGSFGSLADSGLRIVEAAFLPGALFIISKWYKKDEISLRYTLLYCGESSGTHAHYECICIVRVAESLAASPYRPAFFSAYAAR